MFFGKIISQSQPFKFTPSEDEDVEGTVLSLTNVVLAPSSKDSASLWVQKEEEEFLVATLTKEKPQATINLFISLLDDVTLIVKGNGIIHVVGFFEPDQEGDIPFEGEDSEGENEELEGEEDSEE